MEATDLHIMQYKNKLSGVCLRSQKGYLNRLGPHCSVHIYIYIMAVILR
jgi:hypothetical protein